MSDTEIWVKVPIQFYADCYSVSNLGRVRRDVSRTKGRAGIDLAANPDGHGYRVVMLSRDSIVSRQHVHRLVAKAFLGDPEGLTVDHIDGNKLNNMASNLRYLSRADNTRAQWEDGRGVLPRRRPPKLDPEKVRAIRSRLSGGEIARTIASDYGVSIEAIFGIKHGRKWRHVA